MQHAITCSSDVSTADYQTANSKQLGRLIEWAALQNLKPFAQGLQHDDTVGKTETFKQDVRRLRAALACCLPAVYQDDL